jgi:hypothetical protein
VKVNAIGRVETTPLADTKVAPLPSEIHLSPSNNQQRKTTPDSGYPTLTNILNTTNNTADHQDKMAGLQPSGGADQMNMNAGGPAANGQVNNQTPTATFQPTNNNMTPQDQAAFANPARLVGDTILSIATRYATTDIAINVNAAAGKAIMTRYIANYRLKVAIKVYAARIGQTPSQVRADLTATRIAAGIRCNAVKDADTTEADEEHTGDTTEDESESDEEEAAATTTFTIAPPTPAVPSPANDQFLFSNSERLVRETLLTLAERYSNKEISNNIGKKVGTDQFTLSQTAVSRRMTTALEARAKATKITVEQARANLHAARENNGVSVRAANGSRRDSSRKSRSKNSKVEPTPQATTTATAAVRESLDVEMTDASNSQQVYTAAEVDAANALLLLCQAPSQEVVEAASILMTMHRNDGAETEDEVSDVEMDDAERAEFMADFQARWRPGT